MVSNTGESSESSTSRWSHHQSFPSSSTTSSEHIPLVERCVVVARHGGGYGLTVSGGYPVYVDTVRQGGSAHQAGVREGDRIVKVNGMPINTNNLQEVLRMITGTVSRSGGSVKEKEGRGSSHYHQNGHHSHRHTPQEPQMPITREADEGEDEAGEGEKLELAVDGENASEGEAWRQQCVAELTQMLTTEKLNLERLRALLPADTNELEAAHRRISDLHLRLRKLDPLFDDNPPVANILPVSKVEPVKSWVDSGGMHYVQARDAATIEDDEELIGVDEAELNLAEPTGPFSELSELRTRPAHLAIFLNYLISNGDPSSLLFFLITDSYHHTGNVKEMRRYAYEIFSTFLIPNAPLQVPEIGQSLIQSIDKVLRATAAQVAPNDADQLKKLFIPAKRRAIDDINNALGEFRQKRALGLAGIGGYSELYHQLENIARADHATELRICEQVLFKMLETLFSLSNINSATDLLEGCEARCLALIISVATVIKIVINIGRPGYGPWEKLLEKCPTFLTPPKSTVSSSMLSRVMPKRTVQVKDHQFQLNPVNLTTHCYQCRGVVWGVNPHAYACQNCDVVVHKQCASQLADHCYAQQKSSSRGAGSSSAADASNKQNGKLARAGVTGSSTLSLNKSSQPVAMPSSSSSYQHQHQHHQIAAQYGGNELRKASRNSQGDSYSVGGVMRSPEYLLHHHHHRREPSPSARGHHSPSRERLHGVSTSLTPPPQTRSQFVMPPVSPRSRLEDEDASDALIDNVQSPVEDMRALPTTAPSIASVATKRCAPSTTTATSSPSSTSMLPPPVFSQKAQFEWSSAPDLPPNAPPPPPPPAPPPAPSSSSSATPSKPAKLGPRTTAIVVENVKSMSSDSGIGADATAIGSDGRPVVRAHSMKGEAANQIKRAGRATNSLGAGDSRVSEESLPGAALQSVEKTTSDTSIDITQPAVSSTGSAHPPKVTKAMEISREEDEERSKMVESVERIVIEDNDPDFEVETEVPQLESLVSVEVLKHLKPKEKKRQEVINELFHTERTHLRNLKILHKVFYRPLVLQRQIPTSLVHLLFGNLNELLEVHNTMHEKMCEAVRKWRTQQQKNEEVAAGLFGDIGHLVESIFDGPTGEKLKEATALFCMNQQHALDALRMRYNRSNKDDPLSLILADAEQNPLCRKLQLKDMIPVEMQRLVKYPLLLETIAKYTPDPSDELTSIMNAVVHAKKILSAVNAAKRNAENRRRLEELQKRLELEGGIGTAFFSKFDFRDHKLVHDGALVWRQSRGKSVDIHAVLLEHLMVFLAKSGDGGNRLQLKIHEPGGIPLLRLGAVEVEEKANDKRAFSLFCRTDLRMFELIAPTVSERKTWYRLIENQVSVIGGDAAAGGNLTVPFSCSSSLAGSPQPPHLLHQHLVRATVVEGDEPPSTGRIEQVQVMMHPHLVNANQITVQQPKVLEPARPILTPAERLERNDKLIIDALAEKHQILADLLDEEEKRGNKKELDKIAEQMTGLAMTDLKQRNAREVAMSAIVHGNRLLDAINKGMSGKKCDGGDKLAIDDAEKHLPSVACYKLTGIAAPLMNHIKALMQLVQLNEAEVGALRQEIEALKGQTRSEDTPTNHKGGQSTGLANRTQPGNTELEGGIGIGGANLVLRSS